VLVGLIKSHGDCVRPGDPSSLSLALFEVSPVRTVRCREVRSLERHQIHAEHRPA
jgi:hypothetical protein